VPAQASLIEALRARFAAHADAAQAGPMQAYMKSALPFHGLPAPLRRRLVAEAVREHPCPDTATLATTMRRLWREARFREEWYAAQELARVGPHRKLLTPDLLPVYEQMIVQSAWWDCCDEISGNALAPLFERHPDVMKPLLRRWSTGSELWLRRAAILTQRRVKTGFDAPLLYELIEPSLGDARFNGEFFIRKAIGWALRERSYAAPDEVHTWCHANGARLAALTKREALRAIARRATG
jgi:3-methyladenine DNA glycosylase AlkD